MLQTATLVSYPVGTDAGADLATVTYRPPLGLLVVADRLEHEGVSVRVVDLALEWVRFLRERSSPTQFAEHVATLLAAHESEFYGFSSIAGTMPLSIRIAQQLRQKTKAKIGFGGPGASAVAGPLLRAFPEIDFVLRGEVEQALPGFVRDFGTDRLTSCLNVVTWQGRTDGDPLAGGLLEGDRAPIAHAFPMPNIQRWGYQVGLPFIPIEVGRGCPFSCSFCSTNDFFSKNYRLKSPKTIVAEISDVCERERPLGFEFVHDNFTIRPGEVSAICAEMRQAKLDVAWSCSSDIRSITCALLDDMAAAGCRTIFFGVESGSERIQKVIRKNLHLPDVLRYASACAERGISFNCGIIIGFPEETVEDLAKTVNLVGDILAVKDSLPAVGILSPLAGTPYYAKHRQSLRLDRLPSKMAFLGGSFREDEFELIQAHPDVFPEFRYFDTLPVDRTTLKLLEHFLTGAPQTVRYLLVGLRRMGLCLLRTALDWFAEVGANELRDGGLGYYGTFEFRRHFVAFYKKRLDETADLPQAERCFLEGLVAPYVVPMDTFATPETCHVGPRLRSNASLSHGSVSFSRLPRFVDPSKPAPYESIRPTSYLHLFEDGKLRTIELDGRVGSVLEACTGALERDDVVAAAQSKSGLPISQVTEILGHMVSRGLVLDPGQQQLAETRR